MVIQFEPKVTPIKYLTVGKLFQWCNDLINNDPSFADRFVMVSDDNGVESYHPIETGFFTPAPDGSTKIRNCRVRDINRLALLE